MVLLEQAPPRAPAAEATINLELSGGVDWAAHVTEADHLTGGQLI